MHPEMLEVKRDRMLDRVQDGYVMLGFVLLIELRFVLGERLGTRDRTESETLPLD